MGWAARRRGRKGAGGEERVEAVQLEECALAGKFLLVQFGAAAHDEATADVFGLFPGGECGVGDLGDFGIGNPGSGVLVVDRVRVVDRRSRRRRDGRDALAHGGIEAGGDRDVRACGECGVDGGEVVERGIGAEQDPGGAHPGQAAEGCQGVPDQPGRTVRRRTCAPA